MHDVSCKPTCVCRITVHPYIGINLSVEWLSLLLRLREVLGSNRGCVIPLRVTVF